MSDRLVAVLVTPSFSGATPPGIDPEAFLHAIAEDTYELVAGLELITPALVTNLPELEEITWPGTPIIPTTTSAPLSQILNSIHAKPPQPTPPAEPPLPGPSNPPSTYGVTAQEPAADPPSHPSAVYGVSAEELIVEPPLEGSSRRFSTHGVSAEELAADPPSHPSAVYGVSADQLADEPSLKGSSGRSTMYGVTAEELIVEPPSQLSSGYGVSAGEPGGDGELGAGGVEELGDDAVRGEAGRGDGVEWVQVAVVCGDAPDLPPLLIGKLFRALGQAKLAVLPCEGGGLVAVAARMPLEPWAEEVLDDKLLNDPDAVHRLREAAPRRRDVNVGPGWHRLRNPDDLRLLDPGLEGWDSTRYLLGG